MSHKVGDLVYFERSRYETLNKSCLGYIAAINGDAFYVEWFSEDFQRQLPYSALGINKLKRNLKLHLEGFE